MTLNATPGDPTANSLVTMDEATAYMAMILPAYQAAWIAADEPTREAVLMQATMLMSNLPWVGSRAQTTQILCWPRIAGVTISADFSGTGIGWIYDQDGYPVPNGSIPWQVKNGCIEYAFRMLAEDRTADAGGLVPVNLKSGTTQIAGLKRNPIPASVLDIVSPFLRVDPRAGGVMVRA